MYFRPKSFRTIFEKRTPVYSFAAPLLGLAKSIYYIFARKRLSVLVVSSETSEFHGRSNSSLFQVKPTSLDSAVFYFACRQSHSASLRLRAILSPKRGSQRFMCALQMKTHTRKGEVRI